MVALDGLEAVVLLNRGNATASNIAMKLIANEARHAKFRKLGML
jgi:hypothetical protein